MRIDETTARAQMILVDRLQAEPKRAAAIVIETVEAAQLLAEVRKATGLEDL